DVAAGVLAAVTFLAIPIVAAWSQYDRVDMLAYALTWLGLWMVITRARAPRVGLGACCFLLASFTRQTAAIPAIIAAYAWLRHEGRAADANRLVALVAGIGIAALLALNVATGGGFVLHVVSGTVGRVDLGQLLDLGRELAYLIPFLLAIAAAAAFARLFV